MARVFDARKFIFIPATYHPKNAEYRVAQGMEQWSKENGVKEVQVSKTQMVYDGNVAGMLSPSFLDGTHDELAVQLAMKLLKKGQYGTNSKTIKDTMVLKSFESPEGLEMAKSQAIEELKEQNRRIFQKRKGQECVVTVDFKESFSLEHEVPNLNAFMFRVEVNAK